MSILAIWFIIVIVIITASKKKSVNRSSTDSSVNIPRNNMGPISGGPIRNNQQSGRPMQNQQPVRPIQNQQQGRPIQNQPRPVYGQTSECAGSRPYYNQNQTVSSDRNIDFKGKCAARYDEWLEVPRGCSIVKCGYCGAENLVPLSGRNNYQCYFCWKNL